MKAEPVNIKDGYTMRLAEPQDVPGIIACIKEEYGDTYYRREFYDEAILKDNLDKYNIFLVCKDNDICGIQSMIDRHPVDSYMEGATQIFRKKYRGLGLPTSLVSYTYDIAKKADISCIYASAVTFHKITQRMCEKHGMIPVAFNFGSYITAKMGNSFELGHSEKYAQAILVRPVNKQNAGRVYVTEGIKEMTSRLYSELGVQFEIDTTENAPELDASQINVKINEREQTLCIRVDEIGADLQTAVADILNQHKGGLWTSQLILPTSDKESVWAQNKLKKMGFFFVGLRPLCNENKEQLFMQYIGDVKFYPEEFVLTDGFKQLLNDILEAR